MEFMLSRMYIPLIVFLVIIKIASSDSNDTSPEELNGHRESRGAGRIVKLYSGPKAEPILCTGEGFQKDPHNCAVFYRCVQSGNGKYTVFRFQCGPGTIYDPDTEVCNHPRSTKRSECGGYLLPAVETAHINDIESINHEIPSPIVTNKPIYITNTNTSTITTEKLPLSSASTYFTTAADSYPWVSSITNTYPQNSVTSHPPRPTLPHESNIPSATLNIPPSNSGDNICSSDGFMGDSENCRKFYRCVANGRGGYTRYEFTCTETTIWDEEYQVCNHVWAVKRSRCARQNNNINTYDITSSDESPYNSDKGMHEDSDKSNSPTQQQLQISYGSKVTQIQTQISNGPVVQNQTQIHYGDLNNQSLSRQNQTQINQSSAISQSQTQINYGDETIQTQLQVDHSKNASQTQVQVVESSTSITATNAVTERESSNECTDIGFIGDANDCRKFYRCINNGKGRFTKIEFRCAEGTVWDQSIVACNHAWAVKECGSKGSTTSTHNITTTTYKTTQVYYTTTSTENALLASSLEPVDANDDDGYAFQKPTTTNILSTTTSTTISNQINATKNSECTTSGFIGDNNDCKIFYRCVENSGGGFTKYEFKCGEGTVWDPQIEACNHAWAVEKCGNNGYADISKEEGTTVKLLTSTSGQVQSTTSTPLTSEIVQENSDGLDTGYESSNEGIPILTTSTQPPELIENNFKCESSGFVGDKYNCEKFYRCVENGKGDFIRYEFTCSKGTLWDDKINACNHASAVDRCSKSAIDSMNEAGVTTGLTESVKNTTMTFPSTTEISVINTANDAEDDIGYPSNANADPNISIPTSTSHSTTKTVREPNENTVCMSEGFMGDKNNCKRFYRCVDNGLGGFTQYQFDCGEGTVWDQSIQACNHNWAVKECNDTGYNSIQSPQSTSPAAIQTVASSEQTNNTYTTESIANGYYPENSSSSSHVVCSSEGFFGDLSNCKKFYRCVDDGNGRFTKYNFSCGEGTYWSQEILSCDHLSSDKECGEMIHISTSNTPALHEQEDFSTEITTVSKEDNYLTPKPPSSPELCTSDGFYGSKINCKVFYRCVDNGNGGYTKYDFMCGDGTVWDQELQICNHESQGKCSSASTGTESSSEASSTTDRQPQSTTSVSTTTDKNYNPSTTNNIQCVSEGYFADPNDCKRFIQCVQNNKGGYMKYDFDCPNGKVWIQELLTCHENNGDICQSQPEPTLDYQTQKPESNTSGNISQGEEHDSNPPFLTDDICTSEGFYGNKNNCKEFYRCVDNGQGGYTKYTFTCSEGTAWDSHIQGCNHIGKVPNCHGSIVQDEDNTQTTVASITTSQYFSTTPTKKASTTAEPSTETTSQRSNITDKCNSEGYFGDRQDCKRFYRCVDNGKGQYTKYDFTCAEGTIWDQDLITCNHPENVINLSCNQSQLNSEDKNSSSTSIPSNASSSNVTQSSTSHDSNSKIPVNNKINCSKAGFYSNPDDCKKFYRCVDWDGNNTRFSVYHFECGEGTIWDPAVETCNHEQSVYPPRNCSGSQTQGETQSSTTENITTTQEEHTVESTTSSITDSTTQSTTQLTTQPITQSTSQSTVQTTAESTTAQTTAESTTAQTTTESTTAQTTAKSTTSQTTADPTTTQPTTESTTTQMTAESTTTRTTAKSTTAQITTESTTAESTTTQTTADPTSTQPTTESTTTRTTAESTTIQTTTESTTQTTAESTNPSTTQFSTDSTAQSTAPSTTDSITQSTTQSIAQSTTESTSDSTEQITTSREPTTTTVNESTTESMETTTTAKSSESTTEKNNEMTTEKLEGSTTENTGESTTIKSEPSTTERLEESITQKSTESTIENLGASTTENIGESTTAQIQGNTSENSQASTTEMTSETTTSTSGYTTNQESSTEASTTEPTTETTIATDGECPKTEEDQYLFVCPSSFKRHPKYCNMFYQCDENEETHDMKIATFTCPNNTIYDETQIKCVEESKAENKCKGVMAQKRRVKRKGTLNDNDPIVVSKDSFACPYSGSFVFEKGSECSPGFLKCIKTTSNKLRGFVYQCPTGYIFWSVSRRCEPFNKVSDCRRSFTNDWSSRWQIPVETKNVAW